MNRFRRTLTLLSLASLLALPATGFAGERSRGDRGSRDGRHDRDDDSDSDKHRGRGHDRDDDSDSDSDKRRGRGHSDRSSGSYGHDAPRRGDSSYDSHRSRSSRGSYGHSGHRSGHSDHRTRVVVRHPQVVVTSHDYSYPRRYIEPMYLGHDGFHAVMSDLSRARFDDERLDIIRHTARVYTVSTSQVQAMVGVLRFSSNRVEALVTLHSRTRDRENWHHVYDLLTFSGDRHELRRRCGY